MIKDMIGESGLKFFGVVSASISHEIKNRMAVVNEQAGLLKDLVKLSEQGREIELERLSRLAESIKAQVNLTDGILKNMNRFAHSVDSFKCPTDIGDLMSLTASLVKRTADNKGVGIELQLPEFATGIVTAPFLVMNLLWLCLEAIMPWGDMQSPVVMGCEKIDGGAVLRLSAEKWPESGELVLPESTDYFSEMLQARILQAPVEKSITIELESMSASQK